MLLPGDTAPDFYLNTVHGEPFFLRRQLREGQPVLVVFLRHLG